ncbi:hypothetical protein HDU97_005652 [Phlyctochytrium planicorne]|nr:hypothetical protein HDU97_005652 [Phlyctochytrium planicorne]
MPSKHQKKKNQAAKKRQEVDAKMAAELQKSFDAERVEQVRRDEEFARQLQKEETRRFLFGRRDSAVSGVEAAGKVDVETLPVESVELISRPAPSKKTGKEAPWVKVQSKKGKKNAMQAAKSVVHAPVSPPPAVVATPVRLAVVQPVKKEEWVKVESKKRVEKTACVASGSGGRIEPVLRRGAVEVAPAAVQRVPISDFIKTALVNADDELTGDENLVCDYKSGCGIKGCKKMHPERFSPPKPVKIVVPREDVAIGSSVSLADGSPQKIKRVLNVLVIPAAPKKSVATTLLQKEVGRMGGIPATKGGALAGSKGAKTVVRKMGK